MKGQRTLNPTFILYPTLFYPPPITLFSSTPPSLSIPTFRFIPTSLSMPFSFSSPPSSSILPYLSLPPSFNHPQFHLLPPSHPLSPANVELKKGRQPDPNDRASCWRSFKKFSRRVFCYCCCCCCGRGREKDFLVVRRNLFESRQKLKGFFPVIHDGVREDAKHR